MTMEPQGQEDRLHLKAAEGWLELGNYDQANEELENISPALHGRPDFLMLRVAVYGAALKWEHAAEIARAMTQVMPESPFGWIHGAHALHELKRTREAWNLLRPVVDKFPCEFIIPYSLACYACQMGDLKAGASWLKRAFELADNGEVKQMALDDPDLEPLWSAIPQM